MSGKKKLQSEKEGGEVGPGRKENAKKAKYGEWKSGLNSRLTRKSFATIRVDGKSWK